MKKFFGVLIACLSAFVLIACNDTLAPDTTTQDNNSELEALAGSEINISFWHIWGASKSAVLDSMITEFEQMMSDKYEIDVNITSTSQSDYSTLLSKTNQAIAAGDKDSMPTMVIGYPDHFAQYLKSKAVISLDSYINSSSSAISVDLDDYVASYIAENNQFGGVTYSLPLSKSAEFMMYNKSITDACGITIPYDTAITWDTIKSYSNTLFAYTGNGADVQYLVNYDSPANLFINFARQLNAKYTTTEGQLLCTDSTTVTMLSLIENYISNKYLSVPINYSDGASYGSDYFKQQKMVFTIGSTAGYSYNMVGSVPGGESGVLDPENGITYDFNVGFAPVPQFTIGVDTQAASDSVVQQGPNVCILDSGTSDEKLMAWMFIKYMTYQDQYAPTADGANDDGFVEGNNNSARFAISTGYFPVTNIAYSSTLYSQYITLARDYYLNNYSLNGFSEDEVAKLKSGYPQVAYVGYMQTASYQYDPAFAATSKLLGSAKIREEAENCINKVAKNTSTDAATALADMLAACTLG